MKTRDKVKYAFATFLALGTCFAIAAMVYAQYQRERVPEDERQRIRQTLRTYGQVPGGTPMAPASENPAGSEPVLSRPAESPAPARTPASIPTPLAVQHGATQVDPATRP